jgi:hypothetical protein
MITDPPPRAVATRRQYEASERLEAFVPPPPPDALQAATKLFCEAVEGGVIADVRRASVGVLAPLSEFFDVAPPPVKVLGVQPHEVREGVTTYKLYGDYTPDTQAIRVWLKTAIRTKVSTPRSLLSTLLHEFCHHVDCAKLAWGESFHTRGFYHRVDQLYHLALATPDEARRPLVWVRAGSVWRIDWTRSRAPSNAG